LKKRSQNLVNITILSLILSLILMAGCSASDATGAAAAGLVGVWTCFIVIFWLIGVFLFVVWLIMLIDCAKRDNQDFPGAGENTKTMWLLIVILTGGIGAIVYYFMVRRKMPRKINQ
jgi:heme/copper-type cytochrome/quinol oxidase subunit 2